MSKLKISPVELPNTAPKIPEVLPEQQQPETIPEELPEVLEELQPDDGQNLAPELMPETASQSAEFLPHGLQMTTTTNYTPEEFRQKFAGILDFLENPAVANNCMQELILNGRNLTADKIYNVASRYKWLNWIIDRKTQVFADGLQIAAFLAVETNLIVMNWTGLNIFEKGKIWLQQKAELRRQAQKDGKRRTLFGWVFSGRQAAERPTEQNS